MLPGIETKTNLIALCFKKCVSRLFLTMLTYLDSCLLETFRQIKRYVILIVFKIFPFFLVLYSYKKWQKWHFSEHPIGDF